VDFNLSHAEGWAVLATTTGFAVGIDIEAEQGGIARSGIAEHFFAPGEVENLMSLPEETKDSAFLQCWTRKEAYLKGRGGGLSIPLDSFEVSFGPGHPARLIRSDGNPADCRDWTLIDLSRYVPRGFVAAVAVHRREDAFTLEVTGDMRRGTT
jgi:4'-phosphopantetheinyl transferase